MKHTTHLRHRIALTTSAAFLAVAAPLTTGPASAADDEPVPHVDVSTEDGVDGVAVAKAISEIETDDREEFVKQTVDAAFDHDGGDYNVVVMNLSQEHDSTDLGHTRLYANVEWDSMRFGVWIVDDGTFVNEGDGGYINWGFRGWYDRPDDSTTVFHQP